MKIIFLKVQRYYISFECCMIKRSKTPPFWDNLTSQNHISHYHIVENDFFILFAEISDEICNNFIVITQILQ